MKYLILALFCSTFFLSGCLDIYFDITRNTDGSYTMKRTIALGPDFIGQMESFQTLIHDSTKFDIKPVADSIMNEFRFEKDIYLKYPGVLFYDLRDSVHDSVAYIITEIKIKDKTLLTELANEHFLSLKEKDQQGSNKTLQLKLRSQKKRTILEVSLVPERDLTTLAKDELMMFNQYFGGHSIYFRVFSSNILPNASKEVTTIAGGQQWAVPYTILPTIKKGSSKKVQFTLPNLP